MDTPVLDRVYMWKWLSVNWSVCFRLVSAHRHVSLMANSSIWNTEHVLCSLNFLVEMVGMSGLLWHTKAAPMAAVSCLLPSMYMIILSELIWSTSLWLYLNLSTMVILSAGCWCWWYLMLLIATAAVVETVWNSLIDLIANLRYRLSKASPNAPFVDNASPDFSSISK